MEITLEKIELVKDRTGVTYAEAKEALEEADGSVVDAIIAIEETINAGQKKRQFGPRGEALFNNLKALIQKGNVARIQVKREGELILNVPVNAGIVGVVIAPIAAIVAVVASFGFKCVIEVVKDDGTIIDVSDTVTETVGRVAERSSTVVDDVRERSADIYSKGRERGSEIYHKGKERAEEAFDKAKKNAEDARAQREAAKEEAEAEVEKEAEEAVKEAEEKAGEEDK